MGGGVKKNKGRNFGHLKGVSAVRKVVKSSIKLKIPIITFYVFSTENWKRPKTEINFLFKLITNYFEKNIKDVVSNGIKILAIGKTSELPIKIRSTLKKVEKLTDRNKRILVNLAINYGSKDELMHAFKKIQKKE